MKCQLCNDTGWITINGIKFICSHLMIQPRHSRTTNNCNKCFIITDNTGQIKHCSGQCSQ